MQTTTLTRPRQRKPLAPATGTVRVLRAFGVVNYTTAEISVNGKDYYVTRLDTCFRLTGFDGRKGEATVYDLPLTLDSCDCPDAIYRDERSAGACKHARALQALRNQGKL